MDCSAVFIALLAVVLLRQTEMVLSVYLPLVTEISDHTAIVHVTGADTSGIVTFEDVERSLQDKDAIIIDVRKFEEVAELGQIPSAHVLPGL